MSRNKKIKSFVKKNDVHKIITTVFAQGLLSIANFLIAIVLVKYATKEEYGLFVFLFSFVGIFHGYHSAVISAPLMVLVNQKMGSDKEAYVSSLAVGRNYILVPTLVLFSIALIIYKVLIQGDYKYVIASVFIALVIWMYITKEFYRTLHFTLLNTNTVFIMDLLMLVTVLFGTLIMILNKSVNAFAGFLVLCLSYTSSYVYAKSRVPYQRSKELHIKEALRMNWAHGKWLVVGIFSSIFQNRAYIYVISAIIGLGALADVSAAKLFLMPIGLLNLSSSKIIVAKGSIMVAKNEFAKFKKFLVIFILALIGIWVGYLIFLVIFSNAIIRLLGEKYYNTNSLINLWAAYYLIYTIRYILGAGIIVYKRFKDQAKYDFIGALTVIVSCFFFVLFMGNAGAILSLMIGEFIIAVLYLKLFLNMKQEMLLPASDLSFGEAG